jgi:hypothetical protein
MLGLALVATGKSEWDTDANNNIVLSESDSEKITSEFGSKFVEKLLPLLNKDSEPSVKETEDLRASLREHIQSELSSQLESERQAAASKLSAKDLEIAKLQKEKLQLAKENMILTNQEEDLPAGSGKAFDFFPVRSKKAKGEKLMSVNMQAEHYASLQRAAQSGVPVLPQGSSDIDVSDLRREFGVYLSQGNNLDLYVDIMSEFTTGSEMTPVMAAAEYRAVQALTNSVLQQFTPQWTGTNRTKFKPLTIKNRRLKVNASVTPAEVLDSYMLYLYDEHLSPDQMPVTKYILENIVKPAILDDLEMRCVAKGKYVEPSYDDNGKQITGLLPEDSMDGFETILVDNLTNAESGINYYPRAKTMSEFKEMTDEEGLQWVADFAAFITPNMKKGITKVYCSREFFTLYSQWYKSYWAKGSGVDDPDFGSRRIDFTHFKLTALDSMYGSPILFATPQQNFVMLRYRNLVPNIINDVQKHDYTVKFFGEFWFAPGFAIANAVFASVPSGYDPKASINENFNAADQYKGYKTESNALINLVSAAGTNEQIVEVGSQISSVGYKFKGSSASVSWSGPSNSTSVPVGVSSAIVDDVVTISGAPATAGVYNYTVTVVGIKGGSSAVATGKITVVSEGV